MLFSAALASSEMVATAPEGSEYRFVSLPEDRFGLPRWQVEDRAGNLLTAPALASLAGEEALANRVAHRALASRAGAVGLGVLSGSLVFYSALAIQQSVDLEQGEREDRRATGIALAASGMLTGISATLVWREGSWRFGHPHAWWSPDEGELLVNAANSGANWSAP